MNKSKVSSTNGSNFRFKFNGTSSTGSSGSVGVVSMNEGDLNSEFNYMVGRIKTVIDASVVDKVQNKALKDLVSQEIWRRYNSIIELGGGGIKILNDGVVDVA